MASSSGALIRRQLPMLELLYCASQTCLMLLNSEPMEYWT